MKIAHNLNSTSVRGLNGTSSDPVISKYQDRVEEIKKERYKLYDERDAKIKKLQDEIERIKSDALEKHNKLIAEDNKLSDLIEARINELIAAKKLKNSRPESDVQKSFTRFERLTEGSGIVKDDWKKFFSEYGVKNSSDFSKMVSEWKRMANKGELESNYVDFDSWDEYLSINAGDNTSMKDYLDEVKEFADGDFSKW